MPLMLRYVARSDVGLVREGNEDSGYAGRACWPWRTAWGARGR